jgi:hypothetical protein
MMERNKNTGDHSGKKTESRLRWNWYRILLIVVPTLIPVIYFYLSGKENWSLKDLAIVGVIFTVYWVTVFVIAARVLRHKQAIHAINLASPLIEVPLSAELRAKLTDFAAAKELKLAVAAFEILDQEIPRFEQEEERDRARRDNEHLRQQTGQGAFLVAVTTEILKRLLLLSGAQDEDRKLWRSHISKTAARIVSDALDHRPPFTQQIS